MCLFISICSIDQCSLAKPSGLASLLAVSISGRIAGVYVLALKSSIDLAMCVSAIVVNSVLFCVIGDRFFLFRCVQR
jgi:hypothetical protein